MQLPHPRAAERAFVLQPWYDVEPDAEIPDAGTVADLLEKSDRSGLKKRDDLVAPGAVTRGHEATVRHGERRSGAAGRARSRPTPEGRLRPMSPAVALRLGSGRPRRGWVFHASPTAAPACRRQVSWAQPLTLLLVAAILCGHRLVHAPYRSHQRPARLSPHQAVNRLVLARACAYVGALAAGFYFGYAVSWLGVETSDLAGQRAFRSACAGVAGLLIVVGGLLLERACRVPPEDDEP